MKLAEAVAFSHQFSPHHKRIYIISQSAFRELWEDLKATMPNAVPNPARQGKSVAIDKHFVIYDAETDDLAAVRAANLLEEEEFNRRRQGIDVA
jgi:hypothetical protein